MGPRVGGPLSSALRHPSKPSSRSFWRRFRQRPRMKPMEPVAIRADSQPRCRGRAGTRRKQADYLATASRKAGNRFPQDLLRVWLGPPNEKWIERSNVTLFPWQGILPISEDSLTGLFVVFHRRLSTSIRINQITPLGRAEDFSGSFLSRLCSFRFGLISQPTTRLGA